MKRDIKVLIVDDEPRIRELIGAACEKFGAVYDTACDGYSATILMNGIDEGYDCVFLDMRMPDWTGYDALATYKGKAKHIVVVSGMIESEDMQYLESHPNVRAIVGKPFVFNEIIRLVAESPSWRKS
jgi:two-component system OmpR family response regulator